MSAGRKWPTWRGLVFTDPAIRSGCSASLQLESGFHRGLGEAVERQCHGLSRTRLGADVLVKIGVDRVPVLDGCAAELAEILVGCFLEHRGPNNVVALGVPRDQRPEAAELVGKQREVEFLVPHPPNATAIAPSRSAARPHSGVPVIQTLVYLGESSAAS